MLIRSANCRGIRAKYGSNGSFQHGRMVGFLNGRIPRLVPLSSVKQGRGNERDPYINSC